MDDFAVSCLTFLVAIPLAVGGIMLSIKHHSLAGGLVSAVAGALAILPLPLAYCLEQKIIALTGVALAP
jgi:hypothetical protein